MTETATPAKENVMLRIDASTWGKIQKRALQLSTPKRRVTGQELVRQLLETVKPSDLHIHADGLTNT